MCKPIYIHDFEEGSYRGGIGAAHEINKGMDFLKVIILHIIYTVVFYICLCCTMLGIQ